MKSLVERATGSLRIGLPKLGGLTAKLPRGVVLPVVGLLAGVGLSLGVSYGLGGAGGSDQPAVHGSAEKHATADEHAAPDSHASGGVATSLAPEGSLLIHGLADHHEVVEVRLSHELHPSTEAAHVAGPLVALGSPLFHGAGNHHDAAEISLRSDSHAAGAAGMTAAAGQPGAAAPTPSPQPLPPPLAVPDVSVVSGKVEAVEGGTFILSTEAIPIRFRLAEGGRLEKAGPGTTADLQPGQFVGVVGRAAGPARTVRVYSPGPGAPQPGTAPMTGAQQGNVRIVGTITTATSKTLTLAGAGQNAGVALSLGVEILKPVPAAPADHAPGARMTVVGVMGADGVLAASRVTLTEP